MLEFGIASAAVVTPYLHTAINSVLEKARDALAETAVKKAGGVLFAKVKRTERPPINHDLVKAFRRAWLKTMKTMSEDLSKRFGETEDFKKVCSKLEFRAELELANWQHDRVVSVWAGEGLDEVIHLCNSAGREAAGLNMARSSFHQTNAFVEIAERDLAFLLEVDVSLVHQRFSDAVVLGWTSIRGELRLFSDTVKDFFISEIKTDERARSAYGFRLAQDALDRLDKLVDLNAHQLIEVQEISASLISIDAAQAETNQQLATVLANQEFQKEENRQRDLRQHEADAVVHNRLETRLDQIDRRSREISSDVGVIRVLETMPKSISHDDRLLATTTAASWRNLRAGLYVSRPTLLQSALSSSRSLISSATQSQLKVPVFWIDGRSGDGKSVLLLQLAEALLESDEEYEITHVERDRLPDWLKWASQSKDGDKIPIALIDDIAKLNDDQAFTRDLREALSHRTFKAAVLTTGWVSQREDFERRYHKYLDIRPFSVPVPDRGDRATIAAWFGVPLDPDLDRSGAHFVDITFALANGSPETFQETFWENAKAIGLTKSLETLLALNASDMTAEFGLVASPDGLDALEDFYRAEHSIHNTAGNYLDTNTLFHGRVAWFLLSSSVEGRGTLAKNWARCLGPFVAAAAERSEIVLLRKMFKLISASVRYGEAVSVSNKPGDFGDFIKETIDLVKDEEKRLLTVLASLTVLPDQALLSATSLVRAAVDNALGLRKKYPNLVAELVVNDLLNMPAGPSKGPAGHIRWSDSCTLLVSDEVAPYSSAAATRLMGSNLAAVETGDILPTLARKMIHAPDAFEFFSQALLRGSPWAAEPAIFWLERFMGETSSIVVVRSLLMTRHPSGFVRGLAWLKHHGSKAEAALVIDMLWEAVSGVQSSKGLRDLAQVDILAIAWLAANGTDTFRPIIVVGLLKRLWGDPAVLEHAATTLSTLSKASTCDVLIERALDLPRLREAAFQAASQWLAANPKGAKSHSLFHSTKEGATDVELRQLFRAWVNEPSLAIESFTIAVDLLVRNPNDPTSLSIVTHWIKNHPKADGVTLLMETLAAIPAATTSTAKLLLEILPKISGAVDTRDLIWCVVREPRIVRGGAQEIADIIANYAAPGDVYFMAHHFINSATPTYPRANLMLFNALAKKMPYWRNLPQVVHELLSRPPLTFKLVHSTSSWLAKCGHIDGSYEVAKLLVHLVTENLSTVNPDLVGDWGQVNDDIWKWCDLIGDHPVASPIVIELLNSNGTSVEKSVAETLSWLTTATRKAAGPVWEALYDKIRRATASRVLQLSVLKEAERITAEWLSRNAYDVAAPTALMTTIGFEYRDHPRDLRGYVLSVGNRPWKLDLLREWLSNSPDHPGAPFVLRSAITTKGFRRHAVEIVTQWIVHHGSTDVGVGFIESLIEEASKMTLHESYGKLSGKEQDEATKFALELKVLAMQWVVANQTHPGSGFIIGALLSDINEDIGAAVFARSWLAANPKNNTSSFALLKLLSLHDDPLDMALARDWIDRNVNDRNAPTVISTALQRPDGQTFTDAAMGWAASAVGHPGLATILSVLMRSGSGNADFFVSVMEKNIAGFTSPQLFFLLSHFSKWAERYLDLVAHRHVGDGNGPVEGVKLGVPIQTPNVLSHFATHLLATLEGDFDGDAHAARTTAGVLLWSQRLGIVVADIDNSFRGLWSSISEDKGSARWLESYLKSEPHRATVTPIARNWIEKHFRESEASYVITELSKDRSQNEFLLSIVDRMIATSAVVQGLPFIIEALIHADDRPEATGIVEKWLSLGKNLGGWTFVAEAMLRKANELTPVFENILRAAIPNGLGDPGLSALMLATIEKFGWTPAIEAIVEYLLTVEGGIQRLVTKLQTSTTGSRKSETAQLIIVHIYIKYVSRPPPRHIVESTLDALYDSPEKLMNEMQFATSGQSVVCFMGPLIERSATNQGLHSKIVAWLRDPTGAVWRKTLLPLLLEASVGFPEYEQLLKKTIDNPSMTVSHNLRARVGAALEVKAANITSRTSEDGDRGSISGVFSGLGASQKGDEPASVVDDIEMKMAYVNWSIWYRLKAVLAKLLRSG